jgi:hypothetical protein
LVGNGVAAVVELAGAALQFDEVDEVGLEEVGEAATFSLGGFGLAVETSELRGEQFVVGGGVLAVTACSPASSTSGRRMASRT